MPSGGVCRFVCPSACLSVTFVHSVKTSNRIFNIFSPSGSHTVLHVVIPHQTPWQYPDGDPQTGPPNAGRVGTSHDSGRVTGYRSMECE